MSDTNPTPETPKTEAGDEKSGRCSRDGGGRSCRGGHRRRRWRFFAFLGILALGAFALPRAFAHGPGGWSCHHGEISAEQAREHMGRMAEHALDEVDASDDQRAKVDAVLDRAAPDIVAFKGEADEIRESFHETVAADRLDRAELEGLRTDALALADRASARALDAFVEIASVLTPDQRRQLRERAGIEPE